MGRCPGRCDNSYMTPVALLQDRAGAGPNDPTSYRFLELDSTYVIVCLTSSINSSVIVMRSHNLLACCIVNNKGKCTFIPLCFIVCGAPNQRHSLIFKM